MIFLGLASNYSAKDILRHLFSVGTKTDLKNLEQTLAKRYGATLKNTALVYSGRTALYLALEAFKKSGKLKSGDAVAVNAFTCHAVLEAIKKARLTPVFIDLDQNSPNFSLDFLEEKLKTTKNLKVVIAQNSFGLPLDLQKLQSLKATYGFLLLEDLAHSAGRFYDNSTEIGTVGDAVALSFGKGKALDSILGGAVLLRDPTLSFPDFFDKTKLKKPKFSDRFRIRFYPLFGATARGLAHLRLEKPFLALLLKLKFIERSADAKLDSSLSLLPSQAKQISRELSLLKKTPLRDFYLVHDREDCLNELKKSGVRLEELWYEVPVAPSRYYGSVNFPEDECKNAVFFADRVINLPTWYKNPRRLSEIRSALKIIKKYEVKG